MPQCLQNLDAHGEYGTDIRAMELPETLVDICEGDFLISSTADSLKHAKLLSGFAWDTDLATTRVAAKAVFEGVALGQVDDDDCLDNDAQVPYAKYRQGTGFQRSYEIVDAAGAAAPTTWVEGQGFTFAKNPSSNALVNNKIVKTSTANQIVFRAVKSSGSESQTHALVEFAS